MVKAPTFLKIKVLQLTYVNQCIIFESYGRRPVLKKTIANDDDKAIVVKPVNYEWQRIVRHFSWTFPLMK